MNGHTLAVVPDERAHARRGGQERDAPLEPRDLARCRAHQRARERFEAPDGRTRGSPGGFLFLARPADLLVDLLIAGLEHADERAGLELDADRVHLGELRALAEDVQEGLGLGVGALERHPLVKDDGPRDEGEEGQDDEDAHGHAADVAEETPDAARKRCRLGQDEEGGRCQGTSLIALSAETGTTPWGLSTRKAGRTPPDPLQDHHLQPREGPPLVPSSL